MGLKRGWFQNEFLNYKKSWEPAWLVKKVSSRVTLELFWEKNRKTVGRDGWFLLTPALNRVKEHLENLYGTCECCVRNMWGQCFLKRFGDFSINLSITIENLKEYRNLNGQISMGVSASGVNTFYQFQVVCDCFTSNLYVLYTKTSICIITTNIYLHNYSIYK